MAMGIQFGKEIASRKSFGAFSGTCLARDGIECNLKNRFQYNIYFCIPLCPWEPKQQKIHIG